jgi:LPXTG-site transpeptidase (sortase) family protein
MLKTKRGRLGLVLVGVALLIWGATSGFSDWKTLASLQPDALDNPDPNQADWIYPAVNAPQGAAPSSATDTPFQPGGSIGQSTQPAAEPIAQSTLSGEGQVFSVPYGQKSTNGAPAVQATPAGTQPAGLPPLPNGMVPDRIVIPDINLDVPIKKVPYRLIKDDATNFVYQQWAVPNEKAVGWQPTSALLGEPGNTVLDGHHNDYGMVFRYLVDLQPGATIELFSGEMEFKYTITNKMILPERNQPLSVRFSNAQWLLPSSDERITLVTCWPFTSNTHRLIVVAIPTGRVDLSKSPAANQ